MSVLGHHGTVMTAAKRAASLAVFGIGVFPMNRAETGEEIVHGGGRGSIARRSGGCGVSGGGVGRVGHGKVE